MVLATSELVQVLRTLPSFLWFGFAVGLVIVFRHQIAGLLPNLTSLTLPGGIEARFKTAVTTAAAEKGVEVPPAEQSRLLRRAAANAPGLRAARILWIDDTPNSVSAEQQALEALGVRVDLVSTDQAAFQQIGRHQYDLLISDMNRYGDPLAGSKFVSRLRAANHPEPVVFYIGKADRDRGTPPHAFGITDRPDGLLNYVMDIIARRHG